MTAPAWPRDAAINCKAYFELRCLSANSADGRVQYREPDLEELAAIIQRHAPGPSGPAVNAPQFTFVYRNYKGEVSERHVLDVPQPAPDARAGHRRPR